MANHPSNAPSIEDLDDLFSYHPPTTKQRPFYREIRLQAQFLATTILSCCPPCADRSAAIRKVREAVMTANAAIALEPVEEAAGTEKV